MRAGRTDDLIERALSRGDRAAVSCSFQAGGVTLIHRLRHQRPDIPVLFVDTGYHFPETLRFRDELATRWGLNVWTLTADLTVAEQETRHGLLNRTDPDRCCRIRKVEPLYRALGGFDLWFTGLRRGQSPGRQSIRPLERKILPDGHVIGKVNPLLDWSWEDVLDYHRRYSLPLHPLYRDGYQSIGCAPCTVPTGDGDPRAGRWHSSAKIECGLHTQALDPV